MNINLQNIYNDPNYNYTKNYGNKLITQIIQSYFDITNKFFIKTDYNNSLKYANFFIKFNIIHPYISFIYIFSLFNLYPTEINQHYIISMKKNIVIAKPIIDLYNIENLNNYCNYISKL